MIFSLPIPPSVNHLYRRTERGGLALKDNVRAYHQEVFARVREDGYDQEMPAAPYLLTVGLVLKPSKRPKDLDNCLKLVIDSLKTALGFDDNDVHKIIAQKTYKPDTTGLCVVTIETFTA